MKIVIPANLSLWWSARSVRERQILLAWSVIVGLLLVWFGLLAPLGKRIATLEKRVPALEAQLTAMRARPVAVPRTQGASGAASEDLRSTLYGVLAERKLNAELRALSSSRVEMRLPELPMSEALDLLDLLRKESGARVVVLNVRNEGAPGAASRIVVELERAP